MSQTIPATAVLGPGKTGLAIGLRVLNLDGTTYAAFSATGVAETAILGTYRKAGGVAAPASGGYIVWGVSGTDYAEATVEPAWATQASVDDLPTNSELATALAGADDATLAAIAALNDVDAAAVATATAAAILVTPANKLATGSGGEAAADVVTWGAMPVNAADANGNIPVVLYGTQPAVTFGQVKILANVNNQGALHIVNSASGNGIGQYNYGEGAGHSNEGVYSALSNVSSYGVAQYNYSPGGDVSGVDEPGIRAAIGMALANLDEQLAGISSVSQQDIADALLLAPAGVAAVGSAMDYLADILEDTGTTLPGLIAGVGAGSGTGYYSDTVDNGTSPLDGVRVQLYTAQDRVGLAYEAYTNALGVFEMWPDPGTYYRWLDLAGYSFTQDVEVEVTEP